MARIAFLGLGAMGSRMAAKLLDAGHSVTVWNRSPARAEPLRQKGADVAETPRAAAGGAGIVMTMLADDAASEAVWCDPETGALSGMDAGAVAVESSTVSTDWIKALARRAGEAGAAFADAPVSGTRPQAEAGTLVYLVGTTPTTFAALEPVLKSMGSTVHHCGDAGCGMVVKLAVNLLLGVQGVAMAEALGLLERSGLDVGKSVEIIRSTAVCSPAAGIAADLMARGEFSPLFPIGLMEKDFANITAAAQALSCEAPLSQAARERYRKAMDSGMSEENYPAVYKLYRR